MPFLRYLANQHGPATVACVFVCYKYVKFRLVCWRKDCVNEQVCGLVQGKLVEEDDIASGQSTPGFAGLKQPAILEDVGAAPVMEVVPVHCDGAIDICGGGACSDACKGDLTGPQLQEPQLELQQQHSEEMCVSCGTPLWLRRDATEFGVRLESCGCYLHYGCLLELATLQHGMTLPSISDPFHFLTILRRLFGVDAITVDMLDCPGCNTTNRAWTRMKDNGTILTSLGVAATGSALHRGAAICISSLRAALLELAANKHLTVSEKLHKWPVAARSDAALRELLQQAGRGALLDLQELLPDPAARPEAQGASMDGSTRDIGTVTLSATTAKLPKRRCIVPAREHCTRPREPKVYSEFLWLGD